MLYEAEQKDVYKALELTVLGGREPLKTYPINHRNKYDLLTAGDIIDLLLHEDNIFEQMMLALKNHGIGVFTVQFSYMGEFWWSDKLTEMEKFGRIKLLSQEDSLKYTNLTTALGKFSKTPVKCVAFQKCEEDSVSAYQKIEMKKISSLSIGDDI